MPPENLPSLRIYALNGQVFHDQLLRDPSKNTTENPQTGFGNLLEYLLGNYDRHIGGERTELRSLSNYVQLFLYHDDPDREHIGDICVYADRPIDLTAQGPVCVQEPWALVPFALTALLASTWYGLEKIRVMQSNIPDWVWQQAVFFFNDHCNVDPRAGWIGSLYGKPVVVHPSPLEQPSLNPNTRFTLQHATSINPAAAGSEELRYALLMGSGFLPNETPADPRIWSSPQLFHDLGPTDYDGLDIEEPEPLSPISLEFTPMAEDATVHPYHAQYQDVKKLLLQHHVIVLMGEPFAGIGKSFIARQLAAELGEPYACEQHLCTGIELNTGLVDMFENGGLFHVQMNSAWTSADEVQLLANLSSGLRPFGLPEHGPSPHFYLIAETRVGDQNGIDFHHIPEQLAPMTILLRQDHKLFSALLPEHNRPKWNELLLALKETYKLQVNLHTYRYIYDRLYDGASEFEVACELRSPYFSQKEHTSFLSKCTALFKVDVPDNPPAATKKTSSKAASVVKPPQEAAAVGLSAPDGKLHIDGKPVTPAQEEVTEVNFDF